jgi:hypothetical protein
MYGSSYTFRHYIAILRERRDVVGPQGPNHVTRHNTPIPTILSTALQLSITQKALEKLPEDGNIMPEHVGDTIYN